MKGKALRPQSPEYRRMFNVLRLLQLRKTPDEEIASYVERKIRGTLIEVAIKRREPSNN